MAQRAKPERDTDEEQSEFEQFEALTRKLVAVPKDELDRREAEERAAKA